MKKNLCVHNLPDTCSLFWFFWSFLCELCKNFLMNFFVMTVQRIVNFSVICSILFSLLNTRRFISHYANFFIRPFRSMTYDFFNVYNTTFNLMVLLFILNLFMFFPQLDLLTKFGIVPSFVMWVLLLVKKFIAFFHFQKLKFQLSGSIIYLLLLNYLK